MVHEYSKEFGAQVIVWQHTDEGVGEPAIAIKKYDDDTIELKQDKKEILVSKESIPDLIKALKIIYKNE